ncbi:MAG: hypothetical protein QXT38_04195 [Candidatus Aenigmatarchaeota archaeon]
MNQTKKCYKCFTDVDIRAKVCPSCKAKLGKIGKDGIAKKPIGCLIIILLGTVFILGISVIVSIFETQRQSLTQKEETIPQKQTEEEFGVTYYKGYEVNQYNYKIYFDKLLEDLSEQYKFGYTVDTHYPSSYNYLKYPEFAAHIVFLTSDKNYLFESGKAIVKEIYKFVSPLFKNKFGVSVSVWYKPKPDWAEKFYCEFFIAPNSDLNDSKSILCNFDKDKIINDKRILK